MIVLPFSRCWSYFEAGMLFGGFSSTKMTKSNIGLRENPYLEKLADLWQIWPYSRYRGQIHTCSPGRLQGHMWGYQRLDLVSMVHCGCFLSLVQVCYLTPGPKHSKTPFFDPKHHFLTHKRQKIKNRHFSKVRNFLSHDAGDCRMACLYSE